MLSEPPDTLALVQRIHGCEKRRMDFATLLTLVNEYHLSDKFPGLGNYCLEQNELANRELEGLVTSRQKRRGKSYGERDETLHKVRAEVVAEMRRRKKSTGLSWPKVITLLRGNSAYAARLRGKSDETWIRYAKSGFSG